MSALYVLGPNCISLEWTVSESLPACSITPEAQSLLIHLCPPGCDLNWVCWSGLLASLHVTSISKNSYGITQKFLLCWGKLWLQSSKEKDPAKCGPGMTPPSHLLLPWKPLPHKQPSSIEHLNHSCKYPVPCGYPRPLLYLQVNKAPLCLKSSSLITLRFHLPKVQSISEKK